MSITIDEYIAKQTLPQQDICRALRALIHKTIPNANEEMKWGVPTFSDGKYYIVGLKGHVNLGFSTAGLTKEEIALFDGGGKTTKHIQIASMEDINEERIIPLLKMVDERAGG